MVDRGCVIPMLKSLAIFKEDDTNCNSIRLTLLFFNNILLSFNYSRMYYINFEDLLYPCRLDL
jgi:hypothetical protein